jgi:hypothetical protein
MQKAVAAGNLKNLDVLQGKLTTSRQRAEGQARGLPLWTVDDILNHVRNPADASALLQPRRQHRGNLKTGRGLLPTEKEGNHGNDEEDKKTNFSNSGGRSGDAPKTEDGGNDGHDEKDDSIVQHIKV